MRNSSPGSFARGAVLAILTVGLIVTTAGDVPYAWIPCLAAAFVVVSITRALSKKVHRDSDV